jgi:hypothetical protein
MNIFYLDKRTYNCAKDHCDKHVVKMILEYAQLLSTAHRIMDGDEGKDGMYKATHKNHPSAVWVRRNRCHYRYVYNLLRYLCGEYTIRYGKTHKTAQLLPLLLNCPKALETELWDFWEPPQCMPDDYKSDDTVKAYRKYYQTDKAYMAVWKYSPTPSWFKETDDSV